MRSKINFKSCICINMFTFLTSLYRSAFINWFICISVEYMYVFKYFKGRKINGVILACHNFYSKQNSEVLI